MLNRKSLVVLLLSLCSTVLYATEPQNLQITKDILINYYDSGAYTQDINAVVYQAQNYLAAVTAQQAKQTAPEKLAIVFDIDETSLSTYANSYKLNFGGSYDEIRASIDKGQFPAIPATLALYQQAKKAGLHIFFITGRRDTAELRKNTAQNLRAVGFDKYDALYMRPVNDNNSSASTYKTATRKKIVDQGYDIVINIGDQISDLGGGYADRTYKLPNPYYYIP